MTPDEVRAIVRDEIDAWLDSIEPDPAAAITPPDPLVIDPADCGCTDCLTGYSQPENYADTAALLSFATASGRRVIDRR